MPLLTLKEIADMSPVFRGRIGGAVSRGLMGMLAIDKVNALYDHNSHLTGQDFTSSVLQEIGVDYQMINPQILSQLPSGPFVVISNHPYGSIDGIILVDMFARIRQDFKVMVNNFLGRIKTLENNFICVTPTGNQRQAPTKESIQGIKEAVAHIRSGHPIGIFPAGAVSDLSIKDRCVRDRPWQEPVVRLIQKMKVPVVPVHFLDGNSKFYYSLGLIDWKVRLLRLPSEVFNKRNKPVRIALGEIIIPEQMAEYKSVEELGTFLRNRVYNI